MTQHGSREKWRGPCAVAGSCWPPGRAPRSGREAPLAAAAAPPPAPLPEGNTGIASKYIGDFGIDKDPAVIFHDDFESGNLHKWDDFYQAA